MGPSWWTGSFFFFFAEVGKILFAENLVGEKRRERLHIGECRRTRKPVIPWTGSF
jgi:hypothetical protein